MLQKTFVFICLVGYCSAVPLAAYQKRNIPIIAREDTAMANANSMEEADSGQEATAEESAPEMPAPGTLTLPSNATSIRADITDNFSCENKTYGYYADVENDCQIFHVCLPVTYADGKENTFRWSFICPEETIFSQDSFTCMRPEDMTISCEESARYYGLNSNFGAIEEKSVRPSSNQNINMASEEQIQSETITEVEQKPSESEQPQQPAMVKPKPVKVQKPIRRKPAVSYANQKKDALATAPLRKMPQVAPTKIADEEPAFEEPVAAASTQTVVEVEAKPAPQRFNKRPQASATKIAEEAPAAEEPVAVAATQSVIEAKPIPQRFNKRPVNVAQINKEKPQAAKPEATPVRSELFNQKRKRPSYMNKKEAITTPKTVEEAESTDELLATQAAEAELNEPAPTLKLQTMFAMPQEAVYPAEPQLTQDFVAEASEPISTIVQPEEPIKAAIAEEPEPEKVETVEAEPVKEEPIVKAQETPVEIETPAVGVENIEVEAEKAPAPAPIEAFEEIPAVIVEAEESKPEEITSALKKTEEQTLKTEITEPQAAVVEEVVAPLQAAEAPVVAEEPAPAASATFNPENSAEALNNVETMEAEKPADAPESMPATPEMEEHSPMVEEVLGSDDDRQHQTVGGFKPVDPEMAAEAEQLIADFINTLRLNENHDEPNMEHAETIEPVVAEEAPKVVEEPVPEPEQAAEAQPNADATNVQEVVAELSQPAEDVSIEEAKLPSEPQIVDPNVSVEEQLTKDVINEPQMLKNAAPISNILMLEHLPADMYQIPVKVIESPEEAEEVPAVVMPQEDLVPAIHEDEPQQTSVEAQEEAQATATDEKEIALKHVANQEEEVAAPVVPVAVAEEAQVDGQTTVDNNRYAAPISIDDIIELVKERLDQTPKDEQPQPMELVLTSGSDETAPAKMTLKTINEETPSNVEQEAPKTEETEDIVVPIYQRQTETKVQTAEQATQTDDEPTPEEVAVVEEKKDEEAAVAAPEPMATETKPKLDARKRRFLFRADA